MRATSTAVRTTTIAVCSVLDEAAGGGPATRDFRGTTVLSQTLARVAAAAGVDRVVVLAWDDQAGDVADAIADVRLVGPRNPGVAMRQRAAALRWSDGWRGGLLGTCDFDRGFHADAILAAMDAAAGDAVVLANASAALIEPAAIERLIAHLDGPAARHGFAFAPGSPGSGAMALRRDVVERLRKDNAAPGSLLTYHPDHAQSEPLGREASVPVVAAIARSLSRLTVDSSRQAARLSLAQAHEIDAMPREVVVELTTRRVTRPAWSLLSRYAVERPDLTLDAACRIFDEIGGVDDVRVTFAGVGDPLLHPQLSEILAAARERGIAALHVETDLLPTSADAIASLVEAVDIVSVHVPAMAVETYASVMRADRLHDVLENLKTLLIARAARGALPIVVPTFVKLAANLGEMEAWYDQWLRAVGAAAIVGPSDFGGVIAYAGVADMTPPARVACRQLRSRLAVLCDGTIVACEQDLLGRRAVGRLDSMKLADAWTRGLAPLRDAHARGDWMAASPTCGGCRMWDRP